MLVTWAGRRGTPLLLDTYSGAAAAYSTRKLRTAYAGSCMRVRRASDNAEQDIGFVDGVLDEASLIAFAAGSIGFVVTWYDQSGNARNLTQSTAANQLRIISAGVVLKANGKAAAYNTGTNRFMDAAGVVLSQPDTIFSVHEENQTGGTNVFYDGSDSAARQALYATGGALARFSGTVQSSGVAVVANTLRQFSTYFAGASSYLRRNGTLLQATSAGTQGLNGFRIGDGAGAGGGNLSMIGYYSEFIIYASDQSANRAAIESNVMTYFGIT